MFVRMSEYLIGEMERVEYFGALQHSKKPFPSPNVPGEPPGGKIHRAMPTVYESTATRYLQIALQEIVPFTLNPDVE